MFFSLLGCFGGFQCFRVFRGVSVFRVFQVVSVFQGVSVFQVVSVNLYTAFKILFLPKTDSDVPGESAKSGR